MNTTVMFPIATLEADTEKGDRKTRSFIRDWCFRRKKTTGAKGEDKL